MSSQGCRQCSGTTPKIEGGDTLGLCINCFFSLNRLEPVNHGLLEKGERRRQSFLRCIEFTCVAVSQEQNHQDWESTDPVPAACSQSTPQPRPQPPPSGSPHHIVTPLVPERRVEDKTMSRSVSEGAGQESPYFPRRRPRRERSCPYPDASRARRHRETLHVETAAATPVDVETEEGGPVELEFLPPPLLPDVPPRAPCVPLEDEAETVRRRNQRMRLRRRGMKTQLERMRTRLGLPSTATQLEILIAANAALL